MSLIAYVSVKNFDVGLERRLDSTLVGRPVVVTRGSGGRGVVVACSGEAWTAGVRVGMAETRARRLCPAAGFSPGRPVEREAVSAEFMEIIYAFSPLVEPSGKSAAWLELSGSARLFGSPPEIAARVGGLVRRRLGLEAAVGVAHSKLLARVAAGVTGEGGALWVRPGGETDFLWPLPPSALPGVGKKSLERLTALGIRRVGDIPRIGLDLLTAAFGGRGEELFRMASLTPDPLRPAGRRRVVRDSVYLRPGTLVRETLCAHLYRLVEHDAAAVRKLGLAAGRVGFEAMYEDSSMWRGTARLDYPTDLDRLLFDGACRDLDRALQRRVRIVRLEVILDNLVPAVAQGALWSGWEQRIGKLYRSMDSVRDRFGFDSLALGRTLTTENLE
ncbi:hypothetical protein ACFLT7_05940 [candidate division KSB1 bacterium]